jgi:hypothetical protein
MTPAEAATALFKAMPQPITASQLEEYGVEASDPTAQRIAREILSLNLYWVSAAVNAHIPTKYRSAIKDTLCESIQKEWWASGLLGADTWSEYQSELSERIERYARLVDHEGISHMGICAETASLMEDHDIISSEDREKLLVLLIDYAPAAEYGRLLDEMA